MSSFEIVLPANVVETCHIMGAGEGTEFLATSLTKRTISRMKLKKQADMSVRINLTGTESNHYFVCSLALRVGMDSEVAVYYNGLSVSSYASAASRYSAR